MTVIGENEETERIVLRMLTELLSMLEDSFRGHWSFLGPGSEKKWYGTHVCKPDGQWDNPAEDMMLNFAESGHPIFRASSALERGGFEKQIFSPTVCDETIEMILPTVISVNQLCAHGKVAGSVWRLSHRLLERLGIWTSMVIPTAFPTANQNPQTDAEVQGNLLREYEQKFGRTS